jgi:hypothetical protein
MHRQQEIQYGHPNCANPTCNCGQRATRATNKLLASAVHRRPRRIFGELCDHVRMQGLERLQPGILAFVLYRAIQFADHDIAGRPIELCHGIAYDDAYARYDIVSWVRFDGVDYDFNAALAAGSGGKSDAGIAGGSICAAGRVRTCGSELLRDVEPRFLDVVSNPKLRPVRNTAYLDLFQSVVRLTRKFTDPQGEPDNPLNAPAIHAMFIASLRQDFCPLALDRCADLLAEYCVN